jgi:prepilin-type N-terminal cleavage/methylation domain-containing protein
MSQLLRRKNADVEKGFTLIEVMVALVILTIGLMATALLMANVYRLSVRSRYMALASQLASEELEDLNRWPANYNSAPPFIDPHILVPSGSNTCEIPGVTCIGSLTQIPGYGPVTITDLSGNQTPVSYFDSVCLSTQNGVMSETYLDPYSSSPLYDTLSFRPDGQPPQITYSSTPPTVGMTFSRRWVIEQDQPVAGVRRITVLVTLMDRTVQPPLTFQMSMVRP